MGAGGGTGAGPAGCCPSPRAPPSCPAAGRGEREGVKGGSEEEEEASNGGVSGESDGMLVEGNVDSFSAILQNGALSMVFYRNDVLSAIVSQELTNI